MSGSDRRIPYSRSRRDVDLLVATNPMPMIHHISAVTLAVRSMPEAITFYGKLGFTLVYGGPQARFSTLQAGTAFVNLTLSPGYLPAWWGRTIFRVDNVDAVYQTVLAAGYT